MSGRRPVGEDPSHPGLLLKVDISLKVGSFRRRRNLLAEHDVFSEKRNASE